MIKGKSYRVTKQIKIHTKPLIEVNVVMEGTFVKETKSYLIFDSFRVGKQNVLLVDEL